MICDLCSVEQFLSVTEVEDHDEGQQDGVVEVGVESLLEGGGAHHALSTEAEVRTVGDEEVGRD